MCGLSALISILTRKRFFNSNYNNSQKKKKKNKARSFFFLLFSSPNFYRCTFLLPLLLSFVVVVIVNVMSLSVLNFFLSFNFYNKIGKKKKEEKKKKKLFILMLYPQWYVIGFFLCIPTRIQYNFVKKKLLNHIFSSSLSVFPATSLGQQKKIAISRTQWNVSFKLCYNSKTEKEWNDRRTNDDPMLSCKRK